MSFKPLPRSGGAQVVTLTGALWDRLCNMVERANRPTVAYPMEMHESDAGFAFAVHAPDNVVRVVINSQISGRPGYYLGGLPGGATEAFVIWNTGETTLGIGTYGMLSTGTSYIGLYDGRDETEDKPRVSISPFPHAASLVSGVPTVFGSNTEGSETALTDSWNRGDGTYPVAVWVTCRVVYNHAGDKKVYAFIRKLTWDSIGMLQSISAETRIEVDAAGPCT